METLVEVQLEAVFCSGRNALCSESTVINVNLLGRALRISTEHTATHHAQPSRHREQAMLPEQGEEKGHGCQALCGDPGQGCAWGPGTTRTPLY